ncbi:hypothetical protein [Candidatus Uabimicrobium amorphum]|uniref:RNA polymerase sigma-70 region 4 domain-containing protein n=1 Tax=Uabimicrobium amorphum TaxID=2596890 RepID=A0A5S9IQL9_UABAM|nr:hypothetical protein [Candidatus Uabimicrobium amorphum]BBM85917.1 hypothetical protein UABAM_04303 [Candidatus Uabimicrobium amorphum]
MENAKCEDLTSHEWEFLATLSKKLNANEYNLLVRRTRNSDESLAESARKLGIKEDHARKIAHRLRKKIIHILGIGKR